MNTFVRTIDSLVGLYVKSIGHICPLYTRPLFRTFLHHLLIFFIVVVDFLQFCVLIFFFIFLHTDFWINFWICNFCNFRCFDFLHTNFLINLWVCNFCNFRRLTAREWYVPFLTTTEIWTHCIMLILCCFVFLSYNNCNWNHCALVLLFLARNRPIMSNL